MTKGEGSRKKKKKKELLRKRKTSVRDKESKECEVKTAATASV